MSPQGGWAASTLGFAAAKREYQAWLYQPLLLSLVN